MPLFRFHLGGLIESLQTTIIVKNIEDLYRAIGNKYRPWRTKITIEAYPSESDNFDKRIGWYTHIVCGNIIEEDKFHPIGFLSEPL